MSLQDDHERRVAQFPEDVRGAHRHSANHRAELLESNLAGCFYCSQTFPPSLVEEWVDEDENGNGTTALCPRCGIDSVIGSASGFPITAQFLRKMHAYWFQPYAGQLARPTWPAWHLPSKFVTMSPGGPGL